MVIQRPGDLAALIRSKRKSLGYTQEQLAQLTDLTQRSISAIERGGEMRISTLLRVLSTLGIQLIADTLKEQEGQHSEATW